VATAESWLRVVLCAKSLSSSHEASLPFLARGPGGRAPFRKCSHVPPCAGGYGSGSKATCDSPQPAQNSQALPCFAHRKIDRPRGFPWKPLQPPDAGAPASLGIAGQTRPIKLFWLSVPAALGWQARALTKASAMAPNIPASRSTVRISRLLVGAPVTARTAGSSDDAKNSKLLPGLVSIHAILQPAECCTRPGAEAHCGNRDCRKVHL